MEEHDSAVALQCVGQNGGRGAESGGFKLKSSRVELEVVTSVNLRLRLGPDVVGSSVSRGDDKGGDQEEEERHS